MDYIYTIYAGRDGMRMFEETLLLIKKPKMKKSTTVSKKCTTKKGGKKMETVRTMTSVADNISRLANGRYRARKTVDGRRISRNFTNLKTARAWVKSL
jgi:hypothetical protein